MGISELKRSLLLALLLTLALTSSAPADKRVALVIGNSTCKNVGPLDNPANDATLMAQTLVRESGRPWQCYRDDQHWSSVSRRARRWQRL